MSKIRFALIFVFTLLLFFTAADSIAPRVSAVAPAFAPVASGTKYAMLVGIDKYQNGPLNGCVNDVTHLREMLVNNFGFKPENVLVITDAEATRDNILSKLDSYGSKLNRDDLFVLAYAGHGTLFPDSYSEEHDETEQLHFEPDPRNDNKPFFADGKYDAALCPIDSSSDSSGKPWRNLILDDELYARFSKFTAQGAVINYLTDSCFSGTQGRSLYKTRALSLKDALGIPVDKIRKPDVVTRPAGARDLGGRYLVFSSASSLQPASEWRDDDNKSCGLFSYVFRKIVQLQNGKVTYNEIHQASQGVVKQLSKGRQESQLDTRFYTGSLDVQLFDLPRSANAAASTSTAAAAPATTSTPATAAPSTASANPPTAAAPIVPLKVLLRVTDANGKPLANTSFAIFKVDVKPVKGSIRKEDTLILGRTDADGIFDSGAKGETLLPGTYPVKIVREGYKTYQSTLTIGGSSALEGYAVLAFRLDVE